MRRHSLIFLVALLFPTSLVGGAPPIMKDEHLVRLVIQEASAEPLPGKVAVVGVALDRARDRRWPNSERAVVYQGSHSIRTAQFTGMRNSLVKHNWRDIRAARLAVKLARSGTRPCGEVFYYHTAKAKPIWRLKLAKPCRIGAHIFYGDAK